jgi:hypothetical protein
LLLLLLLLLPLDVLQLQVGLPSPKHLPGQTLLQGCVKKTPLMLVMVQHCH